MASSVGMTRPVVSSRMVIGDVVLVEMLCVALNGMVVVVMVNSVVGVVAVVVATTIVVQKADVVMWEPPVVGTPAAETLVVQCVVMADVVPVRSSVVGTGNAVTMAVVAVEIIAVVTTRNVVEMHAVLLVPGAVGMDPAVHPPIPHAVVDTAAVTPQYAVMEVVVGQVRAGAAETPY